MELNRPTPYDIACHFCVSTISGATIPATRLSNILERIFRGQPLTLLSLNYLRQQNLNELYQLATGQITYEAFIAALDPVLVAREQAAKAENQTRTAERLAQERAWHIDAQREIEAAKVARNERAAAQKAQSDHERKAADAARIAYESAWAVQCNHNREAAAATYRTRMREPNYTPPTPRDIARHFRVDHPTAIISPFSNVLEALYQGRPLAAAYLNYLKIKGFTRLYELAIGQATYESYISEIDAAEVARMVAEAARLKQTEAEILRREAAEVARIARESDPAYILRRKYGIFTIAQSSLPRMMAILQNIDSGNRLADEDFVWLNTEVREHFTEELRKTYHLREAEFCGNEYRRTLDPWKAINASGHFRKCDQPESALELLASVPSNRFKHPKIHSAMCTTRGGVMRDLGRRNEALQFGKQGHELQPRNFRPCTLLGAVYVELGNFVDGHGWYAKAEERGASTQSIDTELRGIFLRADKSRRETMRAALLAKDPIRYRWVKNKKYGSDS
ncbi:hypothetical protein SAMN05216271_0444 [Halopseudomonas sabulinigri]|uniref:Uncharacterized protein n=1 Tax=Halopseudomonas sabulinigri TaxID=472181 RepID=A0A1H1M121_9GAMM|nr:hypothetical protein [Halopseudomonas sabulinigri]SDR80514.1 hypothetical protein SAMN05216271_0444 [Halopseudomonas sabulinigri]